MFPLNELLVRSGEVVCDKDGRLSPAFTRKWNAFVRAIDGIGKPSGRGVFRRELPDQVIVSFDVRAVLRESIAFKIDASAGDSADITLVRVGFGLVGGLEPQIDGKPISVEDASGELPALKVKSSDFNDQGRCRLYFKVVCNPDWSRKEVSVVAAADLPEYEPYTGFKLLGLLLDTGSAVRVIQCAKRNLGHDTSERREDGHAKHWWWAADS